MITALTISDKSMNHIGFRQNYLSFTIAVDYGLIRVKKRPDIFSL